MAGDAAHTISVGINGFFLASRNYDAAEILGVGSIAVDGVIATRVSPYISAFDLYMIGCIYCIVVSVGFGKTTVDIDAVLAFDGLAGRISRGL